MGSCQSTSTLDQRTDDNFGCYAMRQVKPFLWRGDLGINCGDLRRFGVICGDLRPIQLAVCFCCQILGGAQPQAPFSCREPKLGGHGPLSPLKTCFLVSTSPTGIHSLRVGWRNLVRVSLIFAIIVSFLLFTVFPLVYVLYFKEFLIHDSRGFMILKKI